MGRMKGNTTSLLSSRVERILHEWRYSRELTESRRKILAESRVRARQQVAEIRAAFHVLEEALLPDSEIIGRSSDRSRASRSLLACKSTFEHWIEHYADLRPQPLRPGHGPGRARETFWAGCRALVASNKAEKGPLAAYLQSTRFRRRLTPVEHDAIFGLAGGIPPLTRIKDRLSPRNNRHSHK